MCTHPSSRATLTLTAALSTVASIMSRGGLMEPLIRTLDDVDATSLALVGGKGANLGELVAAGVPVPAAFCVTTAAYRQLLAAHQLPRAIATLLEGVDYDNPASIEASGAKIRSLLTSATI